MMGVNKAKDYGHMVENSNEESKEEEEDRI
jgi:hypothetical protein